MKLVNLIPLKEIDFRNQDQFDDYQKQSVVEAIDADTSTVYIDPSQFEVVLANRLKEIDAMPLDGNQKYIMSTA